MENVTISLNKTQFEFHFGLGFLGNLIRKNGSSFEKVMEGIQKNPFLTVPEVMYESAQHAARRSKKEFKMSLEEFTDYIDDEGGITSPGVEQFLIGLTASMEKDVPKSEGKLKALIAEQKRQQNLQKK